MKRSLEEIPEAGVSVKKNTSQTMCRKLIETYNTSIIDSFDPTLQDSFFEEAKNCAKNNHMDGKERSVLAKLIENKKKYKDYPLPNVNYVSGPFNITYHWSVKYKKAIYIWGEKHSTKEDCPEREKYTTIYDFLWTHFENSIAFTDFYLEAAAYVLPDGYKNKGVNGKHLNILRHLFEQCIDKTIRDGDPFCYNSRMHFFDIRQGEVKGGTNLASLFKMDIVRFVIAANEILEKHKELKQLCPDIIFLNEIVIFVEKWMSFFEFFENFNSIFIEKYFFGEGFVLRGVTLDHKDHLETLGASWHYDLNHESGDKFNGYLFLEDKKKQIEKWLYTHRRHPNIILNYKLNYQKFWYGQIYNSVILKKEMENMNEDLKPILRMFIKNELNNLIMMNIKNNIDSQIDYESKLDGKIDFSVRNKNQPHSRNVLTGYKKIKYFLIQYKNESFTKDPMTFCKDYQLECENISNIIGSIYNVFITQVLYFNSIITDAYLLARVFKTFKIEHQEKRRSTDEPSEPHNIIIYAGNNHSQRCRKFLKYLGFIPVESAGGLEKPEPHMTNCVMISHITQPFFSKWYDFETDLDPVKMDENSKGSFDLDFQFDSTITNPFKEPVVPPGLKADASLDRRTPDLMLS